MRSVSRSLRKARACREGLCPRAHAQAGGRLGASERRRTPTATGELSTPRLVRFLLALMFNDSPKPGGTSDVRPEVYPPRRAATPKPTTVAMDDKDEIARRLSSLGRVTMKP